MLFGKEIDPVCGMKVKKSKAVATSEYKGKRYYFCAISCKEKFDKDPERYIRRPNAQEDVNNMET